MYLSGQKKLSDDTMMRLVDRLQPRVDWFKFSAAPHLNFPPRCLSAWKHNIQTFLLLLLIAQLKTSILKYSLGAVLV